MTPHFTYSLPLIWLWISGPLAIFAHRPHIGTMKRRSFLLGLSALAAPLPKIRFALPATTAASDHLWVAKLIAETRGSVSASQLATQLRIPKSLAGEVQNLLVRNGVISAPIGGVAQALNPMKIPGLAPAPPPAPLTPNPVAKPAQKPTISKVKDLIEYDWETDEGELVEEVESPVEPTAEKSE